MNCIVLGATKGMGRAVSRALIARGDRLCLLGRNQEDLNRTAQDLHVRGELTSMPEALLCDLGDPDTFSTVLDAAVTALGDVDLVVVTAAVFATQDELDQDHELARRLMQINFVNTIEFCEHASQRLLSNGGGTLCVFSSVAGDRGRAPARIYGSAKAGLSTYLEALDHRYRRQGLRILCVKPGFIRTSMTAGLPSPPFAGNADDVAGRVIRAIDRGDSVVYAPAIWRWIMLVIRLLPRFIMRRSNF